MSLGDKEANVLALWTWHRAVFSAVMWSKYNV